MPFCPSALGLLPPLCVTSATRGQKDGMSISSSRCYHGLCTARFQPLLVRMSMVTERAKMASGQVVRALLRRGADPTAKDALGRTAGMVAVLVGRPGALYEVRA